MKTNKGFSLVELIIVIAIMGILASMSSFIWQRYVDNSNLQTAARQIVSDFQNCKQNAIKENRKYIITFTTGDNSSYIISADSTDSFAAINTIKFLTAENKAGITITDAAFGNSNSITFQKRGTSSPAGHVNMDNLTGSTAHITTNIAGKTSVTFDMR